MKTTTSYKTVRSHINSKKNMIDKVKFMIIKILYKK